MKSNLPCYLDTWSDELGSRANRVRLLIGDAHWLSDGHHKEALLREFLRRHLPQTVSIARGFVRPPDESENCSPEIDILISDAHLHAPFFNEGGLTIVAPSACLAHIEVKTQFDKSTLREAIQSQLATQRVINAYSGTSSKIWRGIAFFSRPESRELESAGITLAETLAECCTDMNANEFLDHAPLCIGILDSYIFFLGKSEKLEHIRIRGFRLDSISMASMVASLFSFLRVERFSTRPTPSELDTLLQSIEPQESWSKDMLITGPVT